MPLGRLSAGHHGVHTRAHVIARTALIWIAIVVVATARARVPAHAGPIQAYLARATHDIACPAVQGIVPKINLTPIVNNLIAVRIVLLALQYVAPASHTRIHHIWGPNRIRRQRLSHPTIVPTLAAVPVVLVDVRANVAAHHKGRIARSRNTAENSLRRNLAFVAQRTRFATEPTICIRAQCRLATVFHISVAIGISEVRARHLAAPAETTPTCAVELAGHPGTGRACVPARAAIERIVVETRCADMARARTRGVRLGAFIARAHRRFGGSRRAVCACIRRFLEAGGRASVRFVGVGPERGTGRGTCAIPENN